MAKASGSGDMHDLGEPECLTQAYVTEKLKCFDCISPNTRYLYVYIVYAFMEDSLSELICELKL